MSEERGILGRQEREIASVTVAGREFRPAPSPEVLDAIKFAAMELNAERRTPHYKWAARTLRDAFPSAFTKEEP